MYVSKFIILKFQTTRISLKPIIIEAIQKVTWHQPGNKRNKHLTELFFLLRIKFQLEFKFYKKIRIKNQVLQIDLIFLQFCE
jgi:hypothetical protein